MYQFSRSIFRELAPGVVPARGEDVTATRMRFLRACECSMERLATDRHYFARPARTLFNDIRVFFPMTAQGKAFRVVDTYMRLCDEWLAAQPATGFDLLGNRLECRATTRKGKPCQRMPLPVNGYCPSHQHLAEAEEREARLAAAA